MPSTASFIQTVAPTRNHWETSTKILPRILRPVLIAIQKIRNESASKINDGLLPPIVLTLLALLYSLLVQSVQRLLLLPGMLVLGLLMLALGAYSLDRCIQERYTQPEQAFHGMLAGTYFWFATEVALSIGGGQISIQTSSIIMLIVGLVITALWRTVLPIGVKFFSMVFLVSWIDRFLFTGQDALIKIWNLPEYIQTGYGWIALGIAILFIGWLFLLSSSRIHRLWAAVFVWFFGLQAVALLCGWSL